MVGALPAVQRGRNKVTCGRRPRYIQADAWPRAAAAQMLQCWRAIRLETCIANWKSVCKKVEKGSNVAETETDQQSREMFRGGPHTRRERHKLHRTVVEKSFKGCAATFSPGSAARWPVWSGLQPASIPYFDTQHQRPPSAALPCSGPARTWQRIVCRCCRCRRHPLPAPHPPRQPQLAVLPL